MAEEFQPGEGETRFSVSLRGYDRDEVDAYVAETAGRIRELEARQAELRARWQEMGGDADRDLKREFEIVGTDVQRVLKEAWEAAEAMRRRAGEDASRWRAEAEQEAAESRGQAADDAQRLRADAWEAAHSLLEQALQEAERTARQAERESLTILAEAERESHRLTANARRQGDDELRSARMEAERLLVEARTRHDEIVETAHREAQSAQERARALEERRKELMEELETARGAIQRLEDDLEARRQALEEPEVDSSVTVMAVDQPPDPEWREGDESVRIVPAPPIQPDSEPIDADSMAAEVERLRSARAAQAPEPVVQTEQPADEVDEDETGDEDELAALFAVLRGEGDGPSAGPEPARQPEIEAAEAPEPKSPPPERPALRSIPTVDAFELRDRLLLPVRNRVLRSVKRQLTEEQNVVLEALRVSEDWTPDPDDLEQRLHGDMVILAQESFAAGHTAASELADAEIARPRVEEGELRDHAAELARDLMELLGESLVEGRVGGQSSRELGTVVSRVFRTWRTDEAERRVQQASLEAFHRGLARSLVGEDDGGEMVWVLSGRGCPDCRTAAERGPVPADEVLMGAIALPPVHPGCGCTLVPATG